MACCNCSTDLPPPPAGWRRVAANPGAVLVTAGGGAWAVWEPVASPHTPPDFALDFSQPGNSRLLVELLY